MSYKCFVCVPDTWPGPTNSGKTYTAMQALCAARSGVYCGPLRLLAVEVHEKLNEVRPAGLLVPGLGLRG